MESGQQNLFNFVRQEVMDEIVKAAKNTRTLEIIYKDKKGEVTRREGEPYEIKNEGLYMYDYKRENIRFFKLAQIFGAEMTNKKFLPRFPIKIM